MTCSCGTSRGRPSSSAAAYGRDRHDVAEALPDRDGGTTVLRATGDLDVAAVPALLPEVPALVSAAGSVVLDLSAVTFFDSSGVRLVDTLTRECGARATPFRVVAPPGGPTRRVLERRRPGQCRRQRRHGGGDPGRHLPGLNGALCPQR